MSEGWSNFAVAVCTGLLAIATFIMAWFTQRMAREAKEGLLQADRHHQENLRPFCMIEFTDVDNQHPFGRGFYRQLGINYASWPADREIRIKGRLVNKGLGLAKDVVVYLNWGSSVGGRAYCLTHPVVVCGLIAANEATEINVLIPEHCVAITVAGGQRVPTGVLEWAAKDTSEIILRYKDVFENSFRTVHAKGFPQNLSIEVDIAGGDVEKEKTLETRQDRPTPVFLTGEQPWQTIADMPKPPREWHGSIDPDPITRPSALD